MAQTVIDLGSPATLIGVDPSAGYVQHVRQRTGDHRAQFLIGDAHELEFAGGMFDVVVSGLVLNFLSDRRQALAEMRRVAREGGTVAAYVWDYAGQMQLMKYFWDTACDLDPPAPSYVMSLNEDRRLALREAIRSRLPAGAGGSITLTARAWAIHGRA